MSYSDADTGKNHVFFFFQMGSGIQTPILIIFHQAFMQWLLSPFIPSQDFFSILLEASSSLSNLHESWDSS